MESVPSAAADSAENSLESNSCPTKSRMEDAMSSNDCVDDGRYRLLVEFAYRHTDFFMADLESVLRLNGILLSDEKTDDDDDDDDNAECRLEALLHQDNFDQLVRERSAKDPTQNIVRRPFALLSFAADSKWAPPISATTTNDVSPNRPCIGQILLDRCVLVRSVIELWAMAPTVKECADTVQRWTSRTRRGQQAMKWYNTDPSRSWKVTIHTLGSTFTMEEQTEMRQHFDFLRFPGPVILTNPDDEFICIREVELGLKGSAAFPRHNSQKHVIAENHARPPLCCYFGRVLRRALKGRGQFQEYTLKNRVYLGPTSMDTELSFVMANLGQVKRGSVVLDPFVGTGSILISCALRGAYCVGTDIDIRVLRGRSSNENIYSNFRQYNLPRPELIRSDNAMYDRHFRKSEPLYDAIVCDPPYGVRAGARKSGIRSTKTIRSLTEEERKTHFPQTKPYAVSDVMEDLLDMAARTLVMGGRLVYIIPSFAEFDPESDLPRHPCLKNVHICYQPLSSELGRRLVALEKVAKYDESQQAEYRQFVWKNGPESAEKCANIREKLYEAAKTKPNYQEKLAFRKQKRKEHKEAKKKAKLQKRDHEQDASTLNEADTTGSNHQQQSS